MRNVTHNDNTCSVGWTCIYGSFTAEDMEFLKQICPSISFSSESTRYDGHRVRTPFDLLQEIEKYKDKLKREHRFVKIEREVSTYVDIPLDDMGIKLLLYLGFDPHKCRFWNRRKTEKTLHQINNDPSDLF